MSEARKAAAAPRGPRANATPRAAQREGSGFRGNKPTKPHRTAQAPQTQLPKSIPKTFPTQPKENFFPLSPTDTARSAALAAFLDQRRMSEARKAAAAPRGPRTNATPRAAQREGSGFRGNIPPRPHRTAQAPQTHPQIHPQNLSQAAKRFLPPLCHRLLQREALRMHVPQRRSSRTRAQAITAHDFFSGRFS